MRARVLAMCILCLAQPSGRLIVENETLLNDDNSTTSYREWSFVVESEESADVIEWSVSDKAKLFLLLSVVWFQ